MVPFRAHNEGVGDTRNTTFGRYLAALRLNIGLTQAQLAAELNRRAGTCSLTRAEIGRYEQQRRIPDTWLPLMAEVLGVDPVKLQEAAKGARRAGRNAGPPLTACGERTLMAPQYDAQEDPVHRRTFLAGAVATTTAEPWGRLAAALESSSITADTVGGIEAATTALYDAEEHEPARQLYGYVTAHLDAVTVMMQRASLGMRPTLVGMAGQAAVLAGWLAYDIGRQDVANRYYATAAQAARQVNDGPLTACVLAYSSYQVEPLQARGLLNTAQEHVRGRGSATARSWLAAREAEECAELGDREGAVRALDRAHTAYDYADPTREQPWARFLRPSRLAGLTVSTLGKLKHMETAEAATRALEAAEYDDAKIQAVVLADVATALVECGNLERGVTIARQALDVTRRTEATLGRQRLAKLSARLPPTRLAQELRAELTAYLL